MAVEERLEVQSRRGYARPFLDLQRELARRDEVGAEPDREDAGRPVDLGSECVDLLAQDQRSWIAEAASVSLRVIARPMAAPARMELAYATVWHHEPSTSGVVSA